MIKIGLTDFTPENKIINIRDKNQVIKAKYAIGKEDVLKYTLMSEHYIEISFELNSNASFKRSDYIEWEGDKFTLRSDYQPKQINKRKYQYTLKFEALEMFFQDVQYWYMGQKLKESEWRMSGNPEYFLKYAVENANRYFNTTEFNIGSVEPSQIKDITFDVNTNTFDALTKIADEYNAEWYLTGTTIHLLNKVSFGDEVDFETEVSVLSMDREEGENTTRYTRLLALGSTRNIPYNYRETLPNEAVDAIYSKRLRIPASKGDVIDAYPNMSPDEVVEGTVIFDEVYPKRVGTIEAVETIKKSDTDENTKEVTKWNAYKIKDSGINFKKEYLLPGIELKLSFQSGDLNGRDFALIFHEKEFSKTDNSQYFEIVRTDEYGKKLPNDTMKPKVGDKYILYGFNIALVSDQYVPAGEQELYDVAVEWQKKQLRDTGVYECPTVIGYFKDHQMDLAIGQKVRLVFDDEYKTIRSSRIMGFEKKLNDKYDAKYTVGDNPTYSRIGNIEQQIKQLQVAGISVDATKAGNGVYVIKQFDSTTPTDFNVYSAKATDAKYLNKQTGGSVQGDTLFQKNLQIQGTALSDVFQNSTFTSGAFGSGFQIKNDSNGSSYGEIDYLTVRKEMYINELIIKKISSIGGSLLLSLASMKTIKVEDKGSYWRCYFDNDGGYITNDFQLNDQAICQIFTGKNIKRYWCLVVGVGSDYIDLSKTDKDGSGVPSRGDEIIQLGNRTNVNRQSARLITTSPANSDSMLEGINSYDLTGKERTAMKAESLGGSHFTGSFTISTNGTTAPIYKDLGLFVNGRTYYLNDRVSHLGSYWVCIVSSTIQTPNETSLVWRKDTSGQADINNAVNNIKVGGRNYVLGSKELKSVASTNTYNYLPLSLSEGLQSNTEYTLSIAKTEILAGTTTPSFTVLVYNPTTNASSSIFTFPISGNRQSYTFKTGNLPDDGYTLLFYTGLSGSASNRSMKWSEVKLEKANKASDWAPAPEDLDSSIEKVRSEYQADFKVLNNQIASKVSQNDFNSLGNRVSTAESSIVQNADNITSTVSKVNTAQSTADSALTTANSKNRTYYQDAMPAVPSGGFKTGDLWYKTSFVDSYGNINADTSKNIYQLQYRWDGSTWKQINWSVSRSKIEQTDSSIKSVIERTGIDSLGSGETLYSKINQTAEQITLEVNKIQIGGNNLLRNSNLLKIGNTGGSSTTSAMETDGSLRIGVTATGQFINNFLINPSLDDSTLADGDMITISYWMKGSVGSPFSFYLKPGMGYYAMQGTVSAEYKQFSITVPYKKAGSLAIHLLPTKTGLFWLKCIQIEKGNKATDWKPATEDIPDRVGSSLAITDNKISLASKTITLDGNTIAKSIKTSDLVVENDLKTSALKVLTDGTFYAKGSNGTNQSLVIDSGSQSIKIESPSSYNGTGKSDDKRSTIHLAPEVGGIRVFDDKGGLTSMSSLGIIANTAGVSPYSTASGFEEYGAIVGLGYGNVDKNYRGDNFIAGVIGIAHNSNANPAPAYGGHFDMLKANGFVLNTRTISDSTTVTTSLSVKDSLVVSLSGVQQIVTLPSQAYQGTVIWLKQWYSGYMRVYPPVGYKLYDDNTGNTYIDINHGETAMCICLGDTTLSGSKIWLFGKFKF